MYEQIPPIHSVEPAPPRETARYNREVERQSRNKTVKILRSIDDYWAGEICGLPAERADYLVRSEFASFDLEAKVPTVDLMAQNFSNRRPNAHAAGDVVVEMTSHWDALNPGEISGFNPDLAARLIKMGVAKAHNPPSFIKRTLKNLRDTVAGR